MEIKKFKRIFLVVMDSVGIGSSPDAHLFGDEGSHTLRHAAQSKPEGLVVPNLEKYGLGTLSDIPGIKKVTNHPESYVFKLIEASNGKDTMTGHWEMVGVHTKKPFKTFTDTGFPQALMDELSEKTGYKLIGNYSASGTEILKELGEEQMRDNSLIVYTSADSVLQIAAHEEVTGLDELYRACEIAREICMRPEYLLGRIIARPYIGKDKNSFKRTANRHDYALSPSEPTVLNILDNNGITVSAIGKISDIFNNYGITRTEKTVSNEDGMDKTIAQARANEFTGLIFTNLVEFDSEYGHRRNPLGYAEAIERFDKRLGELVDAVNDDDLILVTADHGNDPTWHGTDHTREMVPMVAISKAFKHGRRLEKRQSFGDIGATILANYSLRPTATLIGEPITELLED